ncbi:MAG: exodeoxyribonuclease III [Deltaproteobacteria bacterium]|nr:exodeoxyribonuclease III [Deltaproteobacteria bacterium]
MKIYSWNVNGFRAVVGKGFWDWFRSCDADVVCLQEVKAEQGQLAEEHQRIDGYEIAWNASSVKKGYSGTACFYRVPPLTVSTGLPDGRFKGEGRVVRLEYPDYHLLNIYFPNGQMSDERLRFKLGFYDAFLQYAEDLRAHKPVVVCGDFNTAHKEIDLKNPKANEDRSGFLPVEREWMDRFVAQGYVDTFRMFCSEPDHYSWWSYRFGARSRNAGWRIDYFFVSCELESRIQKAWIEPHVQGSDHCPVGIEIGEQAS